MKAIVQDRYGPADVLELRDIDPPRVGDDDVLVRVHAAGVDPGVWHLMTGLPYPVRLGYGLRRPRHRVPGMDLAGVVEAVGRHVTRFAPGDEVYGTGAGSYAEYALAPEHKLARKPAALTFAEAAAIPVSGQTALTAVRDAATVRPDQRVLVIGAGGGVGSYAVQLAAAAGAHVTGVCGPTKPDLVRSLGATDVIDHTREDITDRGVRYDVIVDTAGNRTLTHLRRALTPTGTLVLVGGEAATGRLLQGFDRQLRALLLSPLVGQRLIPLVAKESSENLDALTALVDAGRLRPVLDRSWPLAETADAIRHLRGGHARGKNVVLP
ncbi:NADPH:quinone reductase-like Zn-dependent oxidoreductase [Micromonospora palomenae]|uniref:NADPH:quinone reductase-like Zn-dependent oxidoreductase n=1 Tax=Micromonospora palomenae TaxID=1461247 RepID=A0A561WUM2_9ACTN|nr:NAD(P)-dependent alcohol dehydrogenase [Micromonospora palomenae]TWG27564.1 NADPH:quinone reductase-like Zn-dependent oxidoreductase [Micromonospora palomenae]